MPDVEFGRDEDDDVSAVRVSDVGAAVIVVLALLTGLAVAAFGLLLWAWGIL